MREGRRVLPHGAEARALYPRLRAVDLSRMSRGASQATLRCTLGLLLLGLKCERTESAERRAVGKEELGRDVWGGSPVWMEEDASIQCWLPRAWPEQKLGGTWPGRAATLAGARLRSK